MINAIIAAGGTAGHINPGLAIADKIKDVFPDSDVIFVGTPGGLEAQLVPKAGYGFVPIKMAGFQRALNIKNIAKNIKAVAYYASALKAAKKLIKEFKPNVVVGTGGYVCAPILKAAAKLKIDGTPIKTAVHESNSLPGLGTKMVSKVVDKVFVADEESIKHIPKQEKCIVTGNPIRSRAKIPDKEQALKALGLPHENSFTILSFGGSLGANKISECIASLLKWEEKTGGINHIHAYGKNGKTLFFNLLKEQGVNPSKRVVFKEYFNNMYTCYSAADIIISRSGSMTQTELKAMGKASIQIPWPGATENHQYHNALSMQKSGACIMLEDKDLTPQKLQQTVKELYINREKLKQMEQNAAKMYKQNAASLILSELI
ncbi:MAG: UDP-N-acetylglucosamine--N-acetylmuramyl-(pentapeptide) pyrophosphoryl-undecaprenol N-acetylglucosamine transferase [Oscillospiraceae bacterium]|nr:UDP-N-acetylglucosamine--N-acetylmuramyl-(pentapeptide) pyrophosphoryl-undecaprenol N-acetylglucosamine transferase [Oscillospiraceae bacterium]